MSNQAKMGLTWNSPMQQAHNAAAPLQQAEKQKPTFTARKAFWDEALGNNTKIANLAKAAILEAESAAIEQAEKQEIEPDRNCVENDGCPTEKAVLQRFWREHRQAKKQEPVLWAAKESMFMWGKSDESGHPYHIICRGQRVRSHQIPLYTAPPQREWQGLTDDDYPSIRDGDHAFRAGAEWAEAKLKEKNT